MRKPKDKTALLACSSNDWKDPDWRDKFAMTFISRMPASKDRGYPEFDMDFYCQSANSLVDQLDFFKDWIAKDDKRKFHSNKPTINLRYRMYTGLSRGLVPANEIPWIMLLMMSDKMALPEKPSVIKKLYNWCDLDGKKTIHNMNTFFNHDSSRLGEKTKLVLTEMASDPVDDLDKWFNHVAPKYSFVMASLLISSLLKVDIPKEEKALFDMKRIAAALNQDFMAGKRSEALISSLSYDKL